MAELSSLGSAIRTALTSLTGSQRLPVDAIDGLSEQLASAIVAATTALATANDARANGMPNAVGIPPEYVLTAGKSYVPQGLPSDIVIRDAVERMGVSIDAISPTEGYSILQVKLDSMSEGSTFRLVLDADAGTVALTSVKVDEVDPDLPDKMVLATHFIAPVWTQAEQNIDFNITTAPDSAQPVNAYQIEFDGAARVVSIPAGQPMPYSLDMTPALYPEIWRWGVASWEARARLRAISADGAGPFSEPYALTVSQNTTFFIPDADWTFAEERDSALASGVAGRPKISISVSRTVPDGVELRYFMGTLPYVDANFGTIHSTANSPVISGGASALAAAGNPVGTPLYGILLYREAGTTSRWHPASAQKSFVVQGLIPVGAPTVAVAPVPSGNGKIGSAQSVSTGTWTGSPTSYAFQWLRDGAAIPGAISAGYTPVAADDVTDLSCRITATNAGGSTPYTTPPVRITYPAPTVANTVSNKSYTQESGSYRSVDLSTIFAGAGYEITVSGPSVSGVPVCAVNSLDKTLGISISSILAATTITLTATNSGGSISTTFTLTISAGSAVPAPSIIGVGGSNTAGSAVFTNYAADDMIFAMIRRNSSSGFTKPDLAAFSGQYDWNEIFYGTSSGQTVGLYYRRCNGNGSDGDLGDWSAGLTSTLAFPTYVSIRGVNWSAPIGLKTTADPLTWQAFATNLDHPALTPEGVNSLILDIANHASSITGQGPGLRPGMTEIVSSVTGIRKMLSRSTVIPASALVAANDVPHTVSTSASGAQFCAAVEVKGAASTVSLTWPADVAASKVTVSEVTDPAVASAQGFSGESGHMKYVTAADIPVAATTASGNFELVREIMGGEAPAPAATGSVVTQSQTWYSSSSKSVGGYAYPRFWWRHISSGSMRLALSVTPFEIEGLDGGPAGTFPAIGATGSAEQQLLWKPSGNAYFYTYPKYEATSQDGYQGSLGTRGPAIAVAAYSSWQGNTGTDAYLLAAIRSALAPTACPSCQGGYANQHELDMFTAFYFAKNTPRIWNNGTQGLSSTERNQIDALVKAYAASCATGTRENGDTGNSYSLLGWKNNATLVGNPNFRCAPRLGILVAAAFMGGTSVLKTYLDNITATHPAPTGKTSVRSIYDDLVAKNLDNAAASFHPTRPDQSGQSAGGPSPTYATIAAKCNNWTTQGKSLNQAQDILIAEAEWCFSEVCTYGSIDRSGMSSSDGKIIGTASAALTALVNAGAIGRCHEFESADAEGPRSSASYAMWAQRVVSMGWLVGLVAGMVNKTNTGVVSAMSRFRVGNSYMQEVTEVGYSSYAHAGGGGSETWTYSSKKDQWGIKISFAISDLVEAIFDD